MGVITQKWMVQIAPLHQSYSAPVLWCNILFDNQHSIHVVIMIRSEHQICLSWHRYPSMYSHIWGFISLLQSTSYHLQIQYWDSCTGIARYIVRTILPKWSKIIYKINFSMEVYDYYQISIALICICITKSLRKI